MRHRKPVLVVVGVAALLRGSCTVAAVIVPLACCCLSTSPPTVSASREQGTWRPGPGASAQSGAASRTAAPESGTPAAATEKPTPSEVSPSDGEAPKRPDTSEFIAIPCGPKGYPELTAIDPARKFDFLEFRSTLARTPRELRAGVTSVLLSTGNSCSGAAPEKCKRALAELTPSTGFRGSCGALCVDEYFVGTDGNEAFQVATLEELEAFLGPIDTATEAQLIAMSHRFGVPCGDQFEGTERVAGYRETSDGYELLATIFVAPCPVQYARCIISVSRDGVVSEIWRATTPLTGDYCH